MTSKGVIAAGHEATAKAGQVVLKEGGNAFDAVLAALCTACVAEPVLASLGGGGFLLAHPCGGKPLLYDFFAQTPRHRDTGGEIDFFPIIADFGQAEQEFHIGMGTLATPGVVKGLFEVHKDLGKMPIAKIVEPAIELAKGGVRINRLQAYISTVVEKIYISNETCLNAYGSPNQPGELAREGDTLAFPDFADTLDSLAREGEDLFYRGEIAAALATDSAQGGGYLRRDDMECYQLERRQPLELSYADARILTNPPPSTGGILIAFALALLGEDAFRNEKFGSQHHLQKLISAMMLTNEARIESNLHQNLGQGAADTLLDPGFLESYRKRILGRPKAHRGTTQISVIDNAGNAASLTLSNGEGSAYIVPDTGIMMNNMLGEEDINPHGFNQWPEDIRMCSMMTPSLIEGRNGEITALGSGGSNRIRTAILQVIINLIDFRMPLCEAIESPRLHFEKGLLSVEDGFDEAELASLQGQVSNVKAWGERNMFFGGVHAAHYEPVAGHLEGAGDPRRGGICLRA
ncbi:MAG: gamma-glutamyltransferase [Rhodospirillaceae bacterium]|jgi:gamma-glutamyltranspeptidase / glutathione hydrolase|nr:gamma-glutamyltransferase [Rhodospirillaceae bacterium]MBT5245741.1 gamma-glutamyltransferase [Rhodospirillaceae bacterium]MBT5561469.1 gamma-glutamyltransferase [Rhodospirillaceae bacterium]MBT6242931.1 gamma-glutamyltransferase [Rhodospirillaceae bacterium]